MGKWQAIKNRLSRAVFLQTQLVAGVCSLKGRIDPQVDTTAGHVVTQHGTMAGMDTLGIFLLPDLTAKACNESIGRYWIFDHCWTHLRRECWLGSSPFCVCRFLGGAGYAREFWTDRHGLVIRAGLMRKDH